jgi:phytoene synthase
MEAETLSPLQRVAVAYTPLGVRPFLNDLLSFDARLSQLVSKAREPMLSQMRLAWWRDQLALSPAERARGDPMLMAVSERWRGEEAALVALVDGWEELLGQTPLGEAAIASFADGRGSAFGGFTRLVDCAHLVVDVEAAARRWALADFAGHVRDTREKEFALARMREAPRCAPRLPRALRGVALLDVLTRRAVEEGRAPMTRRSDALLAMRLGLFGR